jgi:hypothetical protein
MFSNRQTVVADAAFRHSAVNAVETLPRPIVEAYDVELSGLDTLGQ